MSDKPDLANSIKKIQLTQGKFAIVDAIHYSGLIKFDWFAYKHSNTFYAIRYSPRRDNNGQQIRMHRQILGLTRGDGVLTDHINGDGLDNRRKNLRIANHRQNSINRRPIKGSVSKFKGVSPGKGGKWQSQTKYKGKSIHIGYYTTEIEAAKAYDAKVKKLFGDYAYLNFPEETP